MKHHRENITRIKAVYNSLGSLKDNVVFVGGATVSLYADRETYDVRPTNDVDIVVEITSHTQYAMIEQQLRDIGFANDPDAKFVGRYLKDGLIVDVMPTADNILGFSNCWYQEGFHYAINYKIDDLHTVKIFDPPHFLASKFEAFKNRGGNDGRTSSDFEDIVFIIENRSVIWQEMTDAPVELKKYLYGEFTSLYNNRHIDEWISAHGNIYSPPTSYIVLGRMKRFLQDHPLNKS